MPVYEVLSLGAGVQSSTLLLLSCRGELPKLDAAIFADTKWEPQAVYQHLEWLEFQATAAGIPVYRVSAGDLRQDALTKWVQGVGGRFASIPLFVNSPSSGREGIIRRQCTKEYKVDPIERFIRRAVLGLAPRQRIPADVTVRQWMGISADEARRVRASTQRWQQFVYPFCGLPEPMLPKTYTRASCHAWLAEHYPERTIPRSACLGCPFHSDTEWQAMKDGPAEEWHDVVEFDRQIRRIHRLDSTCYLHRSLRPLAEVQFQDDTQFSLFGQECLGMCGV